MKKAEKAGLRAYQISRFNEIVSEYARQKDIAILMPKIPGQECQVDWVGDKGGPSTYWFHISVMFYKNRAIFFIKFNKLRL